MTPLERPPQFKGRLTMTEEEAKQLEGAQKDRTARLDNPSDGNRQAPPVGGDGSPGASGNVGGYNYFWIDPGDSYNRVDGQLRTSLLVDPPDGRVPPTLPEAMKRNQARLRATPTSDAAENAETRQRRRLRQHRAAAARRALHHRVQLLVGTPDAADLLLQQHEAGRADQGLRDDPHRDGPRRADHPVQDDARARLPSATGSATRLPAGKATRSSSRRRISTTRRGSADRRTS